MPKQNCFAVRPDSILHAWETTWRVLENDTLAQTLLLGEIGNLGHQKRVRYTPGQEIFLRWEPQTRI
jgi:hypothetical protein